MKHFSAQTGGRYTYTDDIENLQALALAINSIFAGCDNFIVSGCDVSGSSISSGYVYINGELRYFAGASNQTWPCYIYEHNVSETVAYVSGSSKVGRINYGVQIGKTVPTTVDAISGSVPQYVQITSTGGKRMKDAFFAKYALVLNPAVGAQTLAGNVEFSDNVTIKKILGVEKDVNIINGSKIAKHRWDGSKYIIETSNNNVDYKIEFDPTSGLVIYADGTAIQTITSSGMTIAPGKALAASGVFGGNILISTSSITDYGTGSDGLISINMSGYNGGNDYYRDMAFGNGKGVEVFHISGKNNAVTSFLPFSIESGDASITLKDTVHAYGTSNLSSKVIWKDKDGVSVGVFGYADSLEMKLENAKGSVVITGTSYVNLGPVIKENGTPLSDKYVGFAYLTQELEKKANTSEVYTRTVSDSRYARLMSGFTQFVNVGANTAAVLRNQIGATSMTEVQAKHAQLNKYLSDMAVSETAKEQIRTNIGAAPAGSYQEKLSDTGWMFVSGQSNVHVRQIGKLVCIQGKLTMAHSGTVFTLPTGIGSPAYDVSFRADKYNWGAYIAGNSRICIAECENTNCHGKTTSFSMTYMTI